MSCIIKLKSSWIYVDTQKKPEVSYQGTYSCLLWKTKCFLQRAFVRLASTGLQPGSGGWIKHLNAIELLQRM